MSVPACLWSSMNTGSFTPVDTARPNGSPSCQDDPGEDDARRRLGYHPRHTSTSCCKDKSRSYDGNGDTQVGHAWQDVSQDEQQRPVTRHEIARCMQRGDELMMRVGQLTRRCNALTRERDGLMQQLHMEKRRAVDVASSPFSSTSHKSSTTSEKGCQAHTTNEQNRTPPHTRLHSCVAHSALLGVASRAVQLCRSLQHTRRMHKESATRTLSSSQQCSDRLLGAQAQQTDNSTMGSSLCCDTHRRLCANDSHATSRTTEKNTIDWVAWIDHIPVSDAALLPWLARTLEYAHASAHELSRITDQQRTVQEVQTLCLTECVTRSRLIASEAQSRANLLLDCTHDTESYRASMRRAHDAASHDEAHHEAQVRGTLVTLLHDVDTTIEAVSARVYEEERRQGAIAAQQASARTDLQTQLHACRENALEWQAKCTSAREEVRALRELNASLERRVGELEQNCSPLRAQLRQLLFHQSYFCPSGEQS